MIKNFSYPRDKKRLLAYIAKKSKPNTAISKQVSQIISTVRKNKDKALIDYTKKFDGVKLSVNEIKIKYKDIKNASSFIRPELKKAIKVAIQNIRAFHKKQIIKDIHLTGQYGEKLKQRSLPIDPVGVYVPGGQAGNTPLVSTLLMNVIPAQLAGCKNIIVFSPPTAKKTLSSAFLYALNVLNIRSVFLAGGAQAIAAMAYGTSQVPAVNIITGPGNEYVVEAKRQVYGQVMIDGLNGPSEIVVLADKYARPDYIAADLLSQCEHGGQELAVLISPDATVIKNVGKEISEQLKKQPRQEMIRKSLLSRSCTIKVSSLNAGIDISNQIAPEHLELAVKNPTKYISAVKSAGAVFVGDHAPEPIGDYICGTNHVLPTGGTARFASPLSIHTFIKQMNIIQYNKSAFKAYAPHALEISKIEGLSAHGKALTIRGFQ